MEATKIRIKYIEVGYELDESCPLDEKWQFNCQHLETREDEGFYVTPDHRGEPVEHTFPITVCDNCDEEVIND